MSAKDLYRHDSEIAGSKRRSINSLKMKKEVVFHHHEEFKEAVVIIIIYIGREWTQEGCDKYMDVESEQKHPR